MTKCMTPGCNRTEALALGRGLCMPCYKRAKQAVENGTVTWDKLVEMELAKSNEKQDPFTIALHKKLEGEKGADNN